jgi:lantibiotic modifying enzyme
MRAAAILLLSALVLVGARPRAADDAYLDAARDAARWIDASAIQTKDGRVWPADPADPKSVNTTLYAGTPGPILFLLELYRETNDQQYLRSARAGADALLASIAKEREAGLYEGIAGSGFTLGEVYLVTQDRKYLDGALQTVRWLQEHAQHVGAGVQWNDATDVIAGASGTGLYLLWAAHKLNAPGAVDLAAAAGNRLIERGERQNAGIKWMMDSKFPNEMPNFSHGTAGIAYFLADLYQQTHDEKFLHAALDGAKYLQSIADTTGEGCLLYHDSSAPGKSLYYLSWCHGPAGTARLFYRLHQATNDPVWMEWVKKSARALVASGGPERVVTPGDWDNVGMCCGVAAEAEFFLDLHRVTHDATYMELSKKATEYLLRKASRDETGVRWVQAEHRVKPELRVAQTGYMQGASGIGIWLLHARAAAAGIRPHIVFPDNPFEF